MRRVSKLVGGEHKVETTEKWLRKCEGVGVFLSRWLTPLGPVVNVTAGATQYSWPRFFLYDATRRKCSGLYCMCYSASSSATAFRH
jgi:membrane protein DedA with SNARE-associated domain